MDEIFLHLVNISITAGWMILAVLIFRLFFRKSPKWIHCLLWALVGLRLMLPFSISSSFSLIPSTQTIPESSILSTAPVIDSGIPQVDNLINPVISPALTPNPGDSVNPMQVYLCIASLIWFLGVALMLFYSLISWLKLRKRTAVHLRLHDNIYLCDSIEMPFVFGVIRPKIYIPSCLSETHLISIIAHEKAHLKRMDHLWKPLAFALLAIYWFSPLVWLAFILLCRDIENACDEKVAADMDQEGRISYSEALLCCGTHRRNILTYPVAFGEVGVKARISSILHYKKPAVLTLTFGLCAAILAAICFLTDPPNLAKATAQIRRATEARNSLITYDYYGDYLPEYMLGCYIGDDYKLYFRMENGGEELEASLRQTLKDYEDILVFEYSDLTKFTMDDYAESIHNALLEEGFQINSVRVASRSGNITVTVSEEENLKAIRRAAKKLEKYTYGIDVKLYQTWSRHTVREHDNNYMNSIRASERLMMYFYRKGFENEYPDYYAGSYIGDDNLYHIRINRRIKDGEETIRSVLGGYTKYIVFEPANYSYNELKQLSDDLLLKLDELGILMVSVGPDEVNGEIELCVLGDDRRLVENLLNSNFPYPFGHRKFSVKIIEVTY